MRQLSFYREKMLKSAFTGVTEIYELQLSRAIKCNVKTDCFLMFIFVVCMCVCVCARPPQLPLSSSHLDVYTGPGMKGPAIAMTSNSCPANLTIKRELSGAKVNAILSQTTKIKNCL